MSDKLGDNGSELPDGPVAVPIRWASAEALSTVYANELFMTHAGREFYLVFGELAPEYEPGKMPETAWIRSRVGIAVSPENMLRFAEAIQQNVAKYRTKQEDPGDNAE